MTRRPVNLLLEAETYEQLKELTPSLGASVSELVNEFMRSKLKELGQGEGASMETSKLDYEALKRGYEKLIGELDRLEGRLKERQAYLPLIELAHELGLKLDLNNLDQVAPKILDVWSGQEDRDHPLEEAHLFISWLELVREKKGLERKLTLIRHGPEDSLPPGQLIPDPPPAEAQKEKEEVQSIKEPEEAEEEKSGFEEEEEGYEEGEEEEWEEEEEEWEEV